MKRKQMIQIMNTFKGLVGMGDYRITVEEGYHDLKDNLAEVVTDIWEKTMEVTLSKKFKAMEFEQQRNVLIHEIVHARFSAFSSKLSKLAETEEELFINDVVRGLEQLKLEHQEE